MGEAHTTDTKDDATVSLVYQRAFPFPFPGVHLKGLQVGDHNGDRLQARNLNSYDVAFLTGRLVLNWALDGSNLRYPTLGGGKVAPASMLKEMLDAKKLNLSQKTAVTTCVLEGGGFLDGTDRIVINTDNAKVIEAHAKGVLNRKLKPGSCAPVQ